MGRLIDANNLQFNGRNYNKSQVKAILDFIDAQPTAYDPDKVAEQLETMRIRYYCTYANTGNKTNDDVCEKISRAFGVAIEIVKGGRIE